MAITFIASSNHEYVERVDIDPAIPSGSADGDFMIAVCHAASGTGDTGWDDDGGDGNGWTRLFNRYYSGPEEEMELAVFHKFHSGSESTPLFTLNEITSKMASIDTYRGVNATTPWDVTFSVGSHLAEGELTFPSNPSITTATDGSLVIILHCVLDLAGDDLIFSGGAPTGYTLDVDSVNPDENMGVFAARKEIATAGSESPGAWTHTVDAENDVSQYIVATLALRPASESAASPGRLTLLGVGG